MPRIIEIKARCSDPDRVRAVIRGHEARSVGTDHQIDTYFCVPHGRLKLREGEIENNLIFYHRPNDAGPKRSDVHLTPTQPGSPLKALLTAALGVLVVVDKRREIYFVDNVKLHVDEVAGLGTFVEIEAIDDDGSRDIDTLTAQCDHFLERFDVQPHDLVAVSYSDLLLEKGAPATPDAARTHPV